MMHVNKTLEFKQQHGDTTQITAHLQKSSAYISKP